MTTQRTHELKEAHSFLVKRVYLETDLLNERIRNFAMTSAFLATALGVTLGKHPLFACAIAVMGLILGVATIALGVLNELAISFWREYLHRVEAELGVVLDRALFQFYKDPNGVLTLVGSLRASGETPRIMCNVFPWRLGFFRTTSLLVGAWLPILVSAFWFFGLLYLIYGATQKLALVILLFLLTIYAACLLWEEWMPSAVAGQENRHA